MQILYEDKYITVCIKPVGVLSEESGNRQSMPKLLKEHYAEIGERDDLYTLHRLDKNVGGVMVFARNPKSASILAKAIQSRDVIKRYTAVIYGCPDEPSGVYKDLLLHDSSKNKTYTVDRMRKGVREASLEYNVLSSRDHQEKRMSLVQIELHTGRTHQIRVQFASRKMPLVGDGRYGSADGSDTPALWSSTLIFTHPKTKKKMEFHAQPPEIYPFDLFCE